LETPLLVHVDLAGRLQFVYDDALSKLMDCGRPEVKRASHVEPDGPRRWVADMSPVNGPKIGPFPLRSQALSAERAYLDKFLSGELAPQ